MATKTTKKIGLIPDGVIVTRVGTVHAGCEYSAVCGRFDMAQWPGAQYLPLVDLDDDREWNHLAEWLIAQGYRSPAPCSFCTELVRCGGADDD